MSDCQQTIMLIGVGYIIAPFVFIAAYGGWDFLKRVCGPS